MRALVNQAGYAGDVSPTEAWDMLAAEPSAVLVDVRTQAEWTWVGVPDLRRLGKETVFVSWQVFPSMEVNQDFPSELMAGVPDLDAPLLFICRSGHRSKSAAAVATAMGFARCYNVGTGFEGDKDTSKHRGTVGGWKVDGLPWVQG